LISKGALIPWPKNDEISELTMTRMARAAIRYFLGFVLVLSLACCASFEFAGRGPSAPAHHGPKSFVNVPPQPAFTIWTQLRCLIGLEAPDPPAVDPALIRRPDPEAIQLTWIGHSSFLVQVDGLNILTDPVFSRRVSPFSFIGPARLAPSGLDFKDLPPIDAVLISHNHYDHMDKRTLERLGNGPRTFVPLGHHRRLAAWGIFRVSELDWWQTSFLGSVLIHCVPARHNSNRGLFDIDHSLWSGWVVETRMGNIFFAGDTGYGPHFREVAARLGPIRLALLPIGHYGPHRLVKPVHMNPPEAVRAHLDLEAELSIAMHWGTFPMSPAPPAEPMAEPPVYLRIALSQAGLPPSSFLLLKIGQTLVLDERPIPTGTGRQPADRDQDRRTGDRYPDLLLGSSGTAASRYGH
jgi:N-acyl-phosphatidylethanolamine-hydrolysing phospholipase D